MAVCAGPAADKDFVSITRNSLTMSDANRPVTSSTSTSPVTSTPGLPEGQLPLRGRTPDQRDVEVTEPSLSQEWQPDARQLFLQDRKLTPAYARAILARTGRLQSPGLIRSGTRFSASAPASTRPQALSPTQRGGLRPVVFFERFVACIICLVMDRRPVQQKVVSYTAATAHALKSRLQLLTRVLRFKPAGLTREEKVHSRQLLKDLKEEASEARRVSTDEVYNYIQLVKALKKINKDQVASHQIFVQGMHIAGGKASLENIDMTITGVKVVSSPGEQLSPRIQADLKGTLVVPVQGKPPMRIQVDVKGAQVTLEGRMMPFMNSFIQGNSVKNIFRNIHHVRKHSGEMFKLSRVGLQAEKVSARLDDVQAETLTRLIAHSEFSKGRLIERVMAGMNTPMDFRLDELEIFDSDHQQPLVTMEGLNGQVRCPLEGETPDGAQETRSLHLGVEAMHLDTSQSSGLGTDILKKMRRASMELMPGEEPEVKDISHLLDVHAQRSQVDLKNMGMDFEMDFTRAAGRSKPLGSERLKVEVRDLTVVNEGASHLELGVNSARVESNKTPARKEVDASLAGYVADIDFNETLPEQHLELNLHGRVKGKEARVKVANEGRHKEFHCHLREAEITTGDNFSRVRKDLVDVTLPALAQVKVRELKLDSGLDNGSTRLDVQAQRVEGNGSGHIQVSTGSNNWSLPVDAQGELEHINLDYQQRPESELATPNVTAYCSLGKMEMRELALSGARIGDMRVNLDDDGNGELVLEKVELDGSELLKNASLLPEKYKGWMKPYLLKGRKFKFRLALKIADGKLVREQSEITDFDIEHTAEASEDYMGWGAGYLIGALQGLVNRLDVSDLSIENNRLWLELNLKGFRLPLPVPYLTVENGHLDGKGNVSVTGLLQAKAGICLNSEKDRHGDLLSHINAGETPYLHKLLETVGRLERHQRVNLLKRINLDPMLAKAAQGETDSVSMLKSLYTLFRWYPETASKALTIAGVLDQPLTAADIQHFSQPEFIRHIDPVVLAMGMQRAGSYDQACLLMQEALQKTPNNPRLNFFASQVFQSRLNSEWVTGRKQEELYAEQSRIATCLAKAARLGHEQARHQQEQLAAQQDKFAIMARSGACLTTTRKPGEFYLAVADLVSIAGVERKDLSQCALRMLASRALNADSMYLHPDTDQVRLLERQQQMITDGRFDELGPNELYHWGLRYLYGVEGFGQDLNQARFLLDLATRQGHAGARVQQKVLSELVQA